MYNEAKKASNNKYLSKYRTISVRMKHEEAKELDRKAAEAGESVAGYMLHACRDRMNHADVATGESDKEALPDLLTPCARQIAQDASQAAGVPVEIWIERTLNNRAVAEADGRRFMAEVAARKEKEKGG